MLYIIRKKNVQYITFITLIIYIYLNLYTVIFMKLIY